VTACHGTGDELSFGSFDINGVSATVKGDKTADGTSLEEAPEDTDESIGGYDEWPLYPLRFSYLSQR